MSRLRLPHTRGCLACGRDNPQGLKLDLEVDQQSGVVSCIFTPRQEHIGFEGIIHGGALATVLDEAMVWAATWAAKRFCVCAEMTIRFRESSMVGQPLQVEARAISVRSRLISTEAAVSDGRGVLAVAVGKYVPLPPQRNRDFVRTLIEEDQNPAAQTLRQAAGVA
jgi:acyl-coenzyme A thioesterase PaaI-like protein